MSRAYSLNIGSSVEVLSWKSATGLRQWSFLSTSEFRHERLVFSIHGSTKNNNDHWSCPRNPYLLTSFSFPVCPDRQSPEICPRPPHLVQTNWFVIVWFSGFNHEFSFGSNPSLRVPLSRASSISCVFRKSFCPSGFSIASLMICRIVLIASSTDVWQFAEINAWRGSSSPKET